MTASGRYCLLAPEDSRWMDLASVSQDACIFHHPAWLRLLEGCYGFRPFIAALEGENGKLTTGMAVIEMGGGRTGKRWISLPYSDSVEPLYVEGGRQWRDALWGQTLEAAGRTSLEVRAAFGRGKGFSAPTQFVQHLLPLSKDLTLQKKMIGPMHRRNILTAERRNVKILQGKSHEMMDAYFRLHLETRRRQGAPVQPERFFRQLRERLIMKDLGFVMLAVQDEQVLSGAIFLHWRNTLTYKYGASTLEGLTMRPNNLLFWRAIQWGCEHEYTRLDLGRTDLGNMGLRTFKSGWGAKEQPLIYTQSKISGSFRLTNSMEKLLKAVIRNSPAWMCRQLGEILYGRFC